jgi:peptidyl-prolyl cis-trans isomerase B (cyclophilin B)
MRSLFPLILALALAATAVRGDQTIQPQRGVRAVVENPPMSSDMFTCGQDQKLPNPIPERWTTVVLAGDGRLYWPCPGDPPHFPRSPMDPIWEHREYRERRLLAQALRSEEPEVRWRAAQAAVRLLHSPDDYVDLTFEPYSQIGWFIRISGGVVVVPACNGIVQLFGSATYPKRWQPGKLFQLMTDPNPGIQLEAAYGLGAHLSKPGPEPDLVAASFKELQACLARPALDNAVHGAILEDIGVTLYPTPILRHDAEQFLVQESNGAPQVTLGAMRGLEALIRQNPVGVQDERTRERLRQLAVYGARIGQPVEADVSATIRRLAVQSLMAIGDTDSVTLERASNDGDWQIRQLVAGRLDLADQQQFGLGQRFAADAALQVRYELLSPLGRLANQTHECALIARFLTDREPAVVLRAMDVLPAGCTDLDDTVISRLTELSEGMDEPRDPAAWQVPAHAFAALGRLRPEATKPRLPAAAKNLAWQARVVAAIAASVLEDDATLLTLAADAHPNVRTAALMELAGKKHAATVPIAIATVRDASDYQLLRAAALALKGVPEESRDEATGALLTGLRRITELADDTSRDARVAMIDRLAETMRPDRSSDLQYYMADFDDEVIVAATRAFSALIGVEPAQIFERRRRYPYQPVEAALKALPGTALIQLDEGVVTLRFLPDVAPVTVARFVEMALSGKYEDTTFHSVAHNAYALGGGSPGANEYSAPTKRFLRTEAGPQARHIRGAVGMWNHGKDSGDGQFFIDMVDLPRLDHEFTVFAYVTGGMELVDRLLAGAKIVRVMVK